MRLIFAVAALGLASCQTPSPSVATSAAIATTRAEVEAALADSAAGWNSGDQARFMAVYSDAPDTSYVGGRNLLRGKTAIAGNYVRAFASDDPGKRGTLSVETLDFRPLGRDHALLIGRYHLRFADGKEASGLTSLIFRREGGGWKMIADHSG